MNRAVETLKKYNLKDIDDAKNFCLKNGVDVEKIVREIQPICFDNAVEAYALGTAIALKSNPKNACEAAEKIGEGLQAYCTIGSVADGHESFAAAEGAMGIARTANKIRKTPLKVILNGLGKDAAYIIARINGFTYVNTIFDRDSQSLKILGEKRFSSGERGDVKIYGAYDVSEGVAIMQHENVDVSITGNSTNPLRFQHPVAGTYKKWCVENGKKYFSVASGGGTGRTLHPDNMRCGPASYGMTDTIGRMHSDAQFAGSSSVPAHVAMMGFIGMGNNPMVGATVSLAVAVALSKK